jgi:hypothetical protein
MHAWARDGLRPLGFAPAGRPPALLWQVPRSGAGPLQSLYECAGLTLAGPAGVAPALRRAGLGAGDALVAFRPFPEVSRASYVNVDTTTRRGVRRAGRLGLVPRGLADLIVTSDPKDAVEQLLDRRHRGRLLALFRHPVDRLVSKFRYLQTATWDPQYRPRWQNLTVVDFARSRNGDNDHLVRRLAGLGANATATREDLRRAMRTVQQRVVVGLLEDLEESVRRFNLALGVDGADERNARCVEHFLRGSVGARRRSADASTRVSCRCCFC